MAAGEREREREGSACERRGTWTDPLSTVEPRHRLPSSPPVAVFCLQVAGVSLSDSAAPQLMGGTACCCFQTRRSKAGGGGGGERVGDERAAAERSLTSLW